MRPARCRGHMLAHGLTALIHAPSTRHSSPLNPAAGGSSSCSVSAQAGSASRPRGPRHSHGYQLCYLKLSTRPAVPPLPVVKHIIRQAHSPSLSATLLLDAVMKYFMVANPPTDYTSHSTLQHAVRLLCYHSTTTDSSNVDGLLVLLHISPHVVCWRPCCCCTTQGSARRSRRRERDDNRWEHRREFASGTARNLPQDSAFPILRSEPVNDDQAEIALRRRPPCSAMFGITGYRRGSFTGGKLVADSQSRLSCIHSSSRLKGPNLRRDRRSETWSCTSRRG
nr:hypothetical protein CFP56_22255 [Quercus suber]